MIPERVSHSGKHFPLALTRFVLIHIETQVLLTIPGIFLPCCSFSFLLGLVISSIMFSIVDSSMNTIVVAFAEAPAEFEQNHPELSSEMRDAWMKVYPEECGF